jgi:hypothetical protein
MLSNVFLDAQSAAFPFGQTTDLPQMRELAASTIVETRSVQSNPRRVNGHKRAPSSA